MRDTCGKSDFITQELPRIQNTDFYKNVPSFNIFLANKRHDMRTSILNGKYQ
jgi:hypothetical protein